MNRMRTALAGASAVVALALATHAHAQEFDRENAPVTWEHPAYASAEAQYAARFEAAGSDSDEDSLPDWSGVWEQAGFQGFFFSMRPGEPLAGRGFSTVTTMKLTPRYAAEHEARIRQAEEGNDFDPLTWCLPAGFPRWFAEPFTRTYHPAPGQTLLVNEMQNEFRRIYTDGRAHIDEDFAFPLWEGDSIGFWDGDTLVIWTTSLRPNMLQREQPAISGQAQVYEEWTRVADDVMQVKATLYDPEALLEPHDFIRYYQKVDDLDGNLRPAHWSCAENQPVVRTAEGGSDFGVLPGNEEALDLTNAETWLMFDEAEQAGLIAEFEAAAAAAGEE